MEELRCLLNGVPTLTASLSAQSELNVVLTPIVSEPKIKATLSPVTTLKVELTGEHVLSAVLTELDSVIQMEQLNVTENGTYNSVAGRAYNRVVVDVPIPSNYGLITYNGSYLMVS